MQERERWRGRRQERGIEKEHETVTTSIPRNAFNSTFSSPFVDGNMVAMFKEADIMSRHLTTNLNVSGKSEEKFRSNRQVKRNVATQTSQRERHDFSSLFLSIFSTLRNLRAARFRHRRRTSCQTTAVWWAGVHDLSPLNAFVKPILGEALPLRGGGGKGSPQPKCDKEEGSRGEVGASDGDRTSK